MSIGISETFADLKRQLDDASAAFDRTGDQTEQWRIAELQKVIKTTLPGSLADCILKLDLALQSTGADDADWESLGQVGEYMGGETR